MQIELEVQRATQSGSVPDDSQFQCWVEAALLDKPGQAALAIRIVDEQEAQRYNRDYRNQDCATNVLSFPSELPANLPADIDQSQLGDLLICAPLVALEAVQRNRTEADHWAHLTIHGILHLLGYDHEQEAAADEMETLETEILARLGICDPYRLRQ